MVKFKEVNYNEMREKIRMELFAKIEEELPKSKWRRFTEAAELASCGLETPVWEITGLFGVLAAVLIFILAEHKWPGYLCLVPAWIALIKKAMEIHATLKEYKEIENILPEWKLAPYENCVQFAEEYENNSGVYFSASHFLYSHNYLNTMERIEKMQILEITCNAADNYMTITYCDKDGNVNKYSTNCEVRKNTSITETEIEVTTEKLIYVAPYKKSE